MRNQILRLVAFSAWMLAGAVSGYAQAVNEPVVLNVDWENMVYYKGDVNDPSKISRDPVPTVPGATRAFQVSSGIADLVAINGKPIKGAFWYSGSVAAYRLNPPSGASIADFDGAGPYINSWEILGPDGSWIGSLMGGGSFPPAPGNMIVGGNGAFLGVIGEIHAPQQIGPPIRNASTSEDPALRRVNGGGKYRSVVTLYPKFRPTIQVTANGPAIIHADYSPITTAKPALPGELLILAATGLGPVKPDLYPEGSVEFSGPPYQQVNSPVTIMFNGKELPVMTKIGWPGQKGVYWVDFQVPSDATAGTATLQLVVAWIPGPTVTIPVGTR
jgi:uncharacterized protein (TIGR03437 family)